MLNLYGLSLFSHVIVVLNRIPKILDIKCHFRRLLLLTPTLNGLLCKYIQSHRNNNNCCRALLQLYCSLERKPCCSFSLVSFSKGRRRKEEDGQRLYQAEEAEAAVPLDSRRHDMVVKGVVAPSYGLMWIAKLAKFCQPRTLKDSSGGWLSLGGRK